MRWRRLAPDRPSATGSKTAKTAIGSAATKPLAGRSAIMAKTIDMLQREMEAAASALDFERAQRCRDMINLLRGGATWADVEHADFSGLTRQQPGSMGLGTSQQRVTRPDSWKPPAKPDPMTSGRARPRRS